MKTPNQGNSCPNGNKAVKPTVNEESLKIAIAKKSKVIHSKETVRK